MQISRGIYSLSSDAYLGFSFKGPLAIFKGGHTKFIELVERYSHFPGKDLLFDRCGSVGLDSVQ